VEDTRGLGRLKGLAVGARLELGVYEFEGLLHAPVYEFEGLLHAPDAFACNDIS
jgi:hypothetical protein